MEEVREDEQEEDLCKTLGKGGKGEASVTGTQSPGDG